MLSPAWNNTAWESPAQSAPPAVCWRLAAHERNAPAAQGCAPSAGHACSNARAAAGAACSRIESGIADLTAAWTTGCTRTMRASLVSSMISRPARSRLINALRVPFGSGTPPRPAPMMYSHAAAVLNTSPGIP